LKGTVKYLTGLRGYKIDYTVTRNDLVSIIIPTKDQTALLKNTIDSIIALTGYTNYEIIVLNNNSTSKEFYAWVDEYTKKYPQLIQVVEAHFPFNFSKLMNIGAGLAKGEYLLLLNNDVEIIHADWLDIMVSYAQQKRIGAVGVKLLYPDDTVQHAGVVIGLGGIAGHSFVGAYKDDPGYFNYIQSVNNYAAVTAACLMCRKEVFDEVNGMDETFEVEYNDVDFCLKMMEAGFNNVYLPQVELYHYESATRGHPHQSKPSYERHLKEMKLFKDKWQHIIDHDPFYNPNLNMGAHDFSMNFSA
jgi:GT2 family glycosyltransferase